MTTFKDELEKILHKHRNDYMNATKRGHSGLSTAEATQAIIELVDREIIGEDEPSNIRTVDASNTLSNPYYTNNLRAEQRQKLGVKNNE